jgi:hypothetical protein
MGKGCLFSIVAGLLGMLLIAVAAGFIGPRMKNFDAEGFGQHAFLVWLIVAVAPAFLLGYWLSKRKRKAIKGE